MSIYHDMYRTMYGEMPEEHKADFERMIEQEEAFHRRVLQLCLSGGLSY